MTRLAWVAAAFLTLVTAVSLLADVVAPRSYAEQSRSVLSAPASSRFLLGTDELGRDRFSRLVHGMRISLLLAPAAALVSTALAAFLGGLAGYFGGRLEACFGAITGVFLSLPWLFLLLTVRALLPLNVTPVLSVAITFLLLGCLGWAVPARIVRASTRNVVNADYLIQARAGGAGGIRLFCRHMLPNLRPVLFAQFWLSVPIFILSEANLGLLGLGVAEPLPSWGAMLRELENYETVSRNPCMLISAALLIVVMGCFQIVLRSRDVSTA